MKAELKAGKLTLDLCEVLENMSGDELMALIDSVSCMDHVIENVAAQIITGWTEMGSHGGKCYQGVPFTPLDKASRAIAEASGEIAKDEIKKLVDECERQRKSMEQAWAQYHELRSRRDGIVA